MRQKAGVPQYPSLHQNMGYKGHAILSEHALLSPFFSSAVRGDSSYLDFLADQIAIFEERKDPPALPRGERRTIVLEECFVQLWEYGTNWVPRKEFFNLVCAALRNQGYAPITYRHFLRILENTGLGDYFPPMRWRRKRPRRLNGSIDS